MQLIISIIADTPVISSIYVAAANFEILIEVNTTKQNPKRFDELFKMCGDFSVAILKLILNEQKYPTFILAFLIGMQKLVICL